MKNLIYPAIFHKESEYYWVEFPDLEGCQSFADTLEEIYYSAKEALTGYLLTLIQIDKKIPIPSDIFCIEVPMGAFIFLVKSEIINKELVND